MKGVQVTLKELIALQHLAERLRSAKTQRASRQQLGDYQSSYKGRGMDFAEVRAYQSGDDIRHMDWRVTARVNQPYIKCYEEERERPVFFVVDQSASMRFGTRVAFKSVSAAKITALLAWHHLKLGDRIGGMVFNETHFQELKPRQARQGVLPLLQALSTSAISDSTSNVLLSDALCRLSRVAKQRSLIYVISDYYQLAPSTADKHVDFKQSKVYQQLARLRSKHHGVMLRVVDPIEQHIPGMGCYPVSNGQSEFYQLNLTSRRAQQQYQSFFSTWQNQVEQMSQALAMPYTALSSVDQFVPSIRQMLVGR